MNGLDRLRIHLMLLVTCAFGCSVASLSGTLAAAALDAPVPLPPFQTIH